MLNEIHALEKEINDMSPNLLSKPFNERTPRDGELANLIQVVRVLVQFPDQEELAEVRRRIKALQDNPEDCGNHNILS